MYTIETDFDRTYVVALDTLGSFPDVELHINEDGTVYIRQIKHIEVDGVNMEVPDVIALSPAQFHMLKEAMDKPDGTYPITGGKVLLNEILNKRKEEG